MKPRHSITLLQKIANRTQATYLLAFLIHHPICSLTHCTVTDGQTDGCGCFDELHACYRRLGVVPFALPPLEIFTRPWKSRRECRSTIESAAAAHRRDGVPPRPYYAAKTETGGDFRWSRFRDGKGTPDC